MAILSQKNILLSISVLISKRPDTVKKCLESLNSLRRRVPSELILVDTGCGEQVRRLIEAYADRIVDFEWCNDFSKARNAGLREACGEWFLYLDDDEWFEDTVEIEDFFLSGRHKNYNYCSYLQRNYSDPKGRNYRDAYVGRLIRLEPDVKFMYAVHEVFSKARMPWARLHCYVHHYGYVFKNAEEAERHSRRNMELLQAEHAKDPAELRHVAQLAQEYNSLEEWENSIAISQEGIENGDQRRETTAQFLGGLYVNIVRNDLTLKQYGDAIKTGKMYLAREDSDELNRAAICGNLCIAYLEKEEYAKSLEMADRYLIFYRKRERDRDSYAFYESLAAPLFSHGYRQNVLLCAAQDSLRLGKDALVKQYFEEISWNDKSILSEERVRGFIWTLLEAWLCTNAETTGGAQYTAMMGVVLDDGELERIAEEGVESLRKRSPKLLQKKEADWSALADKNWFFLYFKMKNRPEAERESLIKEYGRLWKEPENALMWAGEWGLWEMARRDGVKMAHIISEIPLYRWERAVKTVLEKLDWQEAEQMQTCLRGELDPDGFHWLYWSRAYRMNQILASESGGKTGSDREGLSEKTVKELLEYAAEEERVCRRLYREELFEELPEMLPLECQLSLRLNDMAGAVKKGQISKALKDVQEAAEIMPELSGALRYCTEWISKESRRKKVVLSISILISNRPDTVKKCLESLNSLRERVHSELILVDTGCGEPVRKLIESYADRIVDFEWCNDFAKARNAGLEVAGGEWFLYLDDDEWFEETAEIEDFFLSGRQRQYNDASYLQRNYFDLEGKRYRDEYVGRMIRLEPDTKFVHTIHECFSKARGPRCRLHSYVHHYGYAFRSEEEARRHGQRNISLLQVEREREPGELRHTAHLVKEYNALKEWDQSIDISREGIRNARPGVSTEQFLGGLYVNIVRSHMMLGQFGEAAGAGEEYLELERKRGNRNRPAEAAVCYNLCIVYLELGDYGRSLGAAERYLDFYEKWEKNRDAMAFYEYMAVDYRNEGCRQAALCIAVQDGIRLGYAAPAQRRFAEINWNVIHGMLETQGVRGMVQALVQAWICREAAADCAAAMLDVMRRDAALAGMAAAEICSRILADPDVVLEKGREFTLETGAGQVEEKREQSFRGDRENQREGTAKAAAELSWQELQELYGYLLEVLISGAELYDVLKCCVEWISKRNHSMATEGRT